MLEFELDSSKSQNPTSRGQAREKWGAQLVNQWDVGQLLSPASGRFFSKPWLKWSELGGAAAPHFALSTPAFEPTVMYEAGDGLGLPCSPSDRPRVGD